MTISKDRAVLLAGTASGGNSTSTTGPAMATTRPSFKLGVLPVTVMSDLLDQRVGVLLAVARAALVAGVFESDQRCWQATVVGKANVCAFNIWCVTYLLK